MILNLGTDSVIDDYKTSYNLIKTKIGDRTCRPSDFIWQSWKKYNNNNEDSVAFDVVESFIKSNQKFVYCIGTRSNPKFWLKQYSDNSDTVFFDNIPTNIIEQVKKGNCLLHVDQTNEGFSLLDKPSKYYSTEVVDFYQIIHKGLEKYNIPCKNFIYSTSNLSENSYYDKWSQINNIKEKFHIIAVPFFASLTQSNGWFNYMDLDELSDVHWKVEFQTQLEYKSINKCVLYNCLNRVKRPHREALISMLNYYNLINDNIISHDTLLKQNLMIHAEPWKKHPAFEEDNVNKLKQILPITFDMTDFSINHAQNFNDTIYKTSWISIITETMYADHRPNIFFSEKIFKPMRANHPFILVSFEKSLKHLKLLGFETFAKYWDESYDCIEDPVDRMQAICNVIIELKKKTHQELLDMYKDMQDILQNNFNVLTQTDWLGKKYIDICKKFMENHNEV